MRRKQINHFVTSCTCVRICHATMTILRDCSGCLQVAVASVSDLSEFSEISLPEIRKKARMPKAMAAKRLPTTITTVPVDVPEHLMH